MEKQEFNMDFLPIPYIVIKDKKMNHADEKVMGLIYYMDVRRQDSMKMSNAFIGRTLNMAAGTVANSLKKLSDAGYATCFYKDENKRIRSHIKSNIVTGLVSLTDEGGFTPECRGFHSQMKGVSSGSEQNKINNKINNNITNKIADKNSESVNIGMELCRSLNPVGANNWYRIKVQRESAVKVAELSNKNPELLSFLIGKASEYQGTEYFPVIDSPWALINKMEKLRAALKRMGVVYKKSEDTELEDAAKELGYDLGG